MGISHPYSICRPSISSLSPQHEYKICCFFGTFYSSLFYLFIIYSEYNLSFYIDEFNSKLYNLLISMLLTSSPQNPHRVDDCNKSDTNIGKNSLPHCSHPDRSESYEKSFHSQGKAYVLPNNALCAL